MEWINCEPQAVANKAAIIRDKYVDHDKPNGILWDFGLNFYFQFCKKFIEFIHT